MSLIKLPQLQNGADLQEVVDEHKDHVAVLEAKAYTYMADKDGNNIKSTYATKQELAKKVDLTQIEQSIPDRDISIDQKTLYIPIVNSVREFVTRRDNIVQKAGQDYTDKKSEEMK